MSASPYMPAALLLSQIWESKKSIKTLAYDKSGDLKISKSTYAQVCHVLEHQRTLMEVLKAVSIPCRNEALLYVLLYELLLGPNQKIRGGGAVKRQIIKKEAELRQVLEAFCHDGDDTKRVAFPRYVRVNALKCTMDEAVSTLKLHYDSIYVDEHVPNLLVLQPAAQIHDHPFVNEGKFILQDKSSCFSALCLIHGNRVPLQGDCLDACAAPGNKTSHLAALTSAKVYACDRNQKRLEMLDRRLKLLVTNNQVVTKHLDFLRTKPTDYSNIKGILLDPSCSGSGIFTSLDRMADGEEDGSDRIEHLSNFQLTALQHAMSFNSVERIVYSTCSLHEQENEFVVKQALDSNPCWKLCSPHCLRKWKRRGHDVPGLTKDQSKCLIRADRGDETNGFFVAYFERKDVNEPMKAIENNTGKVVIPKAISLYKGEFATKGDHKSNMKTKQPSNECQLPNTVVKPEKAGLMCSPRASVDAKAISVSKTANSFLEERAKTEKIVARKQAKKMAWKQHQIEQKKLRLLKKPKL